MVKAIYTKFGSWTFLIGILISLIVGLYQAYTLESGENFFETNIGVGSAWILAIVGVIVGILTLAFAFEGNIGLGSIYASVLIHTIMGLLSIAILVKSRRNRWELILVGTTNEFSLINGENVEKGSDKMNLIEKSTKTE